MVAAIALLPLLLALALALAPGPRPCAAFAPPPLRAPPARNPGRGNCLGTAPNRDRALRPAAATALASRGGRGSHGKSGRRRRRRRVRHGVDAGADGDAACWIPDRADLDHRGLARSIDAEYRAEERKRELSFWEVLARERARRPEDISERSRQMSALARTRRRMTYSRGDVESKYTLMAPRNYGEPGLLDRDHLESPPSLEDLNQRPAKFSESYWSRSVFRISVAAGAYAAFPLFLMVFKNFQTVDPYDFDNVVEQLAPNVGVLYATLLALTLQVLYQRLTRIEENVTLEAMLLSQVTRNLLSLFADEPEWAIEACQVVANQLRIMLSRTRGVELLSIMKADTYSNLLAIINDYHYLHGCDDDFSPREESVTNMVRAEIGQLMETRAFRLSDEASSLPPTHFLLIFSLSFVSICAFVTASIKVVTDFAHPPQEASLLFAGLLALYVLFYNFCKDLNGPFIGVYQIKRSNAVSHLMQTKWLIKSQLGDAVDFSDKDSGEPVEASGDFRSLLVGPETEDIAAVEATAMETLVEELEIVPETISPEGACENHGNEQLVEDRVNSLLSGPETEYMATAEANTTHSFIVGATSPEDDPREVVQPTSTSLDPLTDDGGERLLKLKEELAQLKLLKNQLAHSETPSERTDPEARLRHMLEDLDRLKQLNQQLSSMDHDSNEATLPLNPPAADIDNDPSAEKATLDGNALSAVPAQTSRAEMKSVHLGETESNSKLHQMEDELARLKQLHQQLTSTVRIEDKSSLNRAGVGERRRP